LLEKLKALTSQAVARVADSYLTTAEIQALIARRDRLVEFFEKASREKGEANVMFT
jgi:hypothetical protein